MISLPVQLYYYYAVEDAAAQLKEQLDLRPYGSDYAAGALVCDEMKILRQHTCSVYTLLSDCDRVPRSVRVLSIRVP